MLNEHTLSVVHAFWAAHLGCSGDELFSAPLHTVVHGAAWADYDGVFAVFRDGRAVASVPAERADLLRGLLQPLAQGCSPESLAATLGSVSSWVLGRTYLGYAEIVAAPEHPARELDRSDAPVLATLQQACDPEEWSHGRGQAEDPCAAVFVGDRIAALASYNVWDGVLADLFVITHPGFRGRGFGSSAVAYMARRALAAGLLPQYRTLASNRASVRVAEHLGFQSYATTISIRLRPGL